VPVVALNDEHYVIDPAIDPNGPMHASDWFKSMVTDVKTLKISVCHPYTYSPGSDCEAPVAVSYDDLVSRQHYYLSAEWDNLVELQRDPDKELGDSPPWKGAWKGANRLLVEGRVK
jgi:hypothetical protein